MYVSFFMSLLALTLQSQFWSVYSVVVVIWSVALYLAHRMMAQQHHLEHHMQSANTPFEQLYFLPAQWTFVERPFHIASDAFICQVWIFSEHIYALEFLPKRTANFEMNLYNTSKQKRIGIWVNKCKLPDISYVVLFRRIINHHCNAFSIAFHIDSICLSVFLIFHTIIWLWTYKYMNFVQLCNVGSASEWILINIW